MTKATGGGLNYYYYDADGKRARRVIGAQEYWQVYGFEGELVAEYTYGGVTAPAPTATQKEYGHRSGQMLVVAQCDVMRWLVADHLGSPRMEADVTGTLAGIRRHDYLPFGEEIGAGVGFRTTGQGYTADCVRQRFTEKERDTETGLDYFIARFYANTQGRFTSVDLLLASGQIGDPQSWNRYAYAFNNPLKYIDPLGLYNWHASAGGSFTDEELREMQNDKSLSKQERKYAERALKFRERFRNALATAAQAATSNELNQEQQAQVRESVNAYGSENDNNGVIVGVRANAPGSAATARVNENDTITVTFNERLEGNKLAAVTAHEGRHVADGRAWLSTHATGGPTDLNHFHREFRAWYDSSYIAQALGLKSYGPDGGGSEYHVWNKGWKEADRSILRLGGVGRILQLGLLNRTSTDDTYSREHTHRP
jgi:RHS repeat-associated protein